MSTRLYTWGWLGAVLFFTLLIRIPHLSTVGHAYDLSLFAEWGTGVYSSGLWGAYLNVPSSNYPPVYVALLGGAAALWSMGVSQVVALKLFPVLCELLLVAAVARWLRHEKGLHWLVPLLLALNPGIWLPVSYGDKRSR